METHKTHPSHDHFLLLVRKFCFPACFRLEEGEKLFWTLLSLSRFLLKHRRLCLMLFSSAAEAQWLGARGANSQHYTTLSEIFGVFSPLKNPAPIALLFSSSNTFKLPFGLNATCFAVCVQKLIKYFIRSFPLIFFLYFSPSQYVL